ncbi:YheU family protein [Vibrio rarus]|uniref:YheU family protein n=1 Tax=Vibrio rarus TaxID=413403 RepID=UPI0021C37CB7|nr:YheU family protein [Vibrio rarus]
MIVPWKEIAPQTLETLIKEYILREGTDYGDVEISLQDKIEQIQLQLQQGTAVIVYSELHESIDIKVSHNAKLL